MTTMRSILLATATLATLAACAAPPTGTAADQAANANKPGWTGRTFVLGSTSTVAGDAQATYDQQKWQYGRGR